MLGFWVCNILGVAMLQSAGCDVVPGFAHPTNLQSLTVPVFSSSLSGTTIDLTGVFVIMKELAAAGLFRLCRLPGKGVGCSVSCEIELAIVCAFSEMSLGRMRVQLAKFHKADVGKLQCNISGISSVIRANTACEIQTVGLACCPLACKAGLATRYHSGDC